MNQPDKIDALSVCLQTDPPMPDEQDARCVQHDRFFRVQKECASWMRIGGSCRTRQDTSRSHAIGSGDETRWMGALSVQVVHNHHPGYVPLGSSQGTQCSPQSDLTVDARQPQVRHIGVLEKNL